VTSNWQLVVSVLLAKGVRRSVFSVQYSVFSIQSFFAEDVLGARVILLSTHHSLDGTAISRNLEILDFRFSAIFNSRFSIVVYRFKRQIANGKRQNSIYHWRASRGSSWSDWQPLSPAPHSPLTTHSKALPFPATLKFSILDFRFSAIFDSRFSIFVYRFNRQMANGKTASTTDVRLTCPHDLTGNRWALRLTHISPLPRRHYHFSQPWNFRFSIFDSRQFSILGNFRFSIFDFRLSAILDCRLSIVDSNGKRQCGIYHWRAPHVSSWSDWQPL